VIGLGLTDEEQARVRVALRFLRFRAGGWKPISAALGFKRKTLTNVSEGKNVSPNMAFRVARLAGISVDELLAGKWPLRGVCPHCGHVAIGAAV
jgi:hypothetical protein